MAKLPLALLGAILIAGVAQAQPPPDSGRYSDAEKAFVPAAATARVADAPRKVTLQVVTGRKFSPTPGGPIVISNPYMDPGTVFFAQAVGIMATADGALLVGGRAGLDKDSRALGTGYWRIAPGGEISPVATRSTNTYGKTPATK